MSCNGSSLFLGDGFCLGDLVGCGQRWFDEDRLSVSKTDEAEKQIHVAFLQIHSLRLIATVREVLSKVVFLSE